MKTIIKNVMIKLINLHNHNAFIALISLFSNNMSCKYWNVEKVPITEDVAINKAKTPKLSGSYNLYKIGDRPIAINWAVAVPVKSLKTLIEKSDFLSLENNLYNSDFIFFKIY